MVIRVVTYNAHFGANTEAISVAFKSNPNLALADIIFLQEIEHYPKELKSRAEKISLELGMFCFYADARPKKTGTHGIAILSKYPLMENKILELPRFKLGVGSRRRIALISKVDIEGKTITLCNIHLDARLNARQRISQMDFALKKLKHSSAHDVILGGDFNTHPLLLFKNVLPVFYQNQYQLLHEHLLKNNFKYFSKPSFRTMRRVPVPMVLDHIYTSSLPVLKSGVEREIKTSDHYPVWVDINIA